MDGVKTEEVDVNIEAEPVKKETDKGRGPEPVKQETDKGRGPVKKEKDKPVKKEVKQEPKVNVALQSRASIFLARKAVANAQDFFQEKGHEVTSLESLAEARKQVLFAAHGDKTSDDPVAVAACKRHYETLKAHFTSSSESFGHLLKLINIDSIYPCGPCNEAYNDAVKNGSVGGPPRDLLVNNKCLKAALVRSFCRGCCSVGNQSREHRGRIPQRGKQL